MISNYNSRSHSISEDAYDEATIIDYIGNYSCVTGTSSNSYPLNSFAFSNNTSSSSNVNHHQSQASSLHSLNHSSALSGPFVEGVGKMFNTFLSSSLTPVTMASGTMDSAITSASHMSHQSTTSPLSSLGELSESNSPVNNNHMYDADDSGLDTTNMSCTTTDGYFFTSHPDRNALLPPHHSAQPLSGQIHHTVNHTGQLNHADVAARSDHTTVTRPSSQSSDTHPHQSTQQQQQQQLSHHSTGMNEQVGAFFNCAMRNRALSIQSDCSNVASDTSTLAEYSSLSRDHGSLSSSRIRLSPTRQPLSESSTSGQQMRSQAEQTSIGEETSSTLLEFPISYNALQSSGASNGVICPSGVQLKIMSEPARHHRARYRTEGSRGAIKDRTGRSFPVIKLTGYNSEPVKLHCYIGHDRRHGEPHLYYQVSRIIGKNITPCNVIKARGVKMIEIDLLPENDMTAVINCIGIVKERNFDVQRRCIVTGCAARTSVASGATGKGRTTSCCSGRGNSTCVKRKHSSTTGRVNSGQMGNRGNVQSTLITSNISKCPSGSPVSSGKGDNANSHCSRTGEVKSRACFSASINEHGTQSMAKSNSTSRYPVERRSTTCTLVFTCVIHTNGTSSNLIAVSDVINCAQILGSPEIHKVSLARDRATGGSEVFVIGKNFTRDCKIVWDICPSHIKSHFTTPVDFKFWWRESDAESDFTNQNHLVFKVPPLKSLINETQEQVIHTDGDSTSCSEQPSADQVAYVNNALFSSSHVQVTFRIKCGEKVSEPHLFTFISTDVPSHCDNLYQPPHF